MPKYFDVHSHLNFADYGDDQGQVIARMKEKGVWTVAVGTDQKTSTEAVALAKTHEEIFACIGVHPVDDKESVFNSSEWESLAQESKVVAIGECGLDFFRTDAGDESEKKRQKNLFISQIEFALKHDKPLMIHSRSAYKEVASILQSYKKENQTLSGNIHFFTGSLEEAKLFLNLDFYLSFPGVITFARDYDEVIQYMPIERILSETDAPFASPAPWRGKRNEPSYVTEVASFLARIRGTEEEEMKKSLVQNAFSLFKLTDTKVAGVLSL
jgi:TatD DNase family protein